MSFGHDVQKDLKPRAFLEQIGELAEAFRQKIELEVEAFAVDGDARRKRIDQVNDPDGYRFFAETYFPHYLKAPPSKLHQHLYESFPTILATEKGCKELVIAPRGSAKSTHVSLIFPLWCIVRAAKHNIALIMDAFEQAAIMLEALKAELEVNPRLAYDFPDIVGQGRTWREGDIITRNNIKLEAFGTAKKIRGRRHGPHRIDLVLMDDIENDENVESPRQRQKLENWVLKAVMELGPADGSMDVLYAGTVLHHDAVIVRFSRKPGWNVHEFRAILEWPSDMPLWERWEEIYLNEGEDAADDFYGENKVWMDDGAVVNWPEEQPLLFLMKKRAGSHNAFESEYQNNPISDNALFQDLTYWVMTRRDWLFFGAIDPSLGKRNRHGDPSAILIGGYADGIMDVVEASIRRRLPDVIMDDAIALQKEYGAALWFVEAVQFQELFRTDLMAKAVLKHVAMPCVPVTPIADKALRIERLQPAVAAGQIRFHKAHSTLLSQLQQYPNADHDDGPDCLEMLWTGAVQYGGGALTGDAIRTTAVAADTLQGFRLL